MKVSNSAVPVYTLAGAEARPLPDWLVRRRKRSLKNDPTFANRVELLQDFEFEEASCCVRVSEDGDWLMSTGTYKPQIHVHSLAQLSLSFARHTNTLNTTFRLLSSDSGKSVHLQADRTIELHTPGGCHYSVRTPRYGRDLLLDRQSAECLIPAAGVNQDNMGECYRLNLEVGRFMNSYHIDLGDQDTTSIGAGSLQGGINIGAVNTGAIAEETHNLLCFGTSIGTLELWDSRSRNRVGILSTPQEFESRPEITAVTFRRNGLEMATGDSNGLIHLYDLRRPIPMQKLDQGFGHPIKNLIYLESSTQSEPKILTADKKIIKVWNLNDSHKPWTSVEPSVDLNHVEWVPNTGMILTANEGKQQHAFFIPQLGPAPRWCSFIDNVVEEMAEDPNDPNAFGKTGGEVYDSYKFCTLPQLRQLNLDHLVGTTSLLRPYMHGYFVAQKLYEEARLISNPDLWQEQRAKNIQEKINKERESRIRGNKKAAVKVNRKLAERMLEREEKNERRKARRVLERGGDDDMVDADKAPAVGEAEESKPPSGVLHDPRFARLFEDEDFEVDEESHEFQAINPSTKLPKGLTAVEQEGLESRRGSSDESSSESETEQLRPIKKQAPEDKDRISSLSYKKSGRKPQRGPQMVVSSSTRRAQPSRDKTFGSRVSKLKDNKPASSSTTTVVGEREITFAPERKQKKRPEADVEGQRHDRKTDRRSASGNVFRNM